jgi:hypothetical protein
MLAEIQNELAGGGIAGGMIAVVYGVIELLKHRRTKRRDNGSSLQTLDNSLQKIAENTGAQTELMRNHHAALECIRSGVEKQSQQLELMASKPCPGSEAVRQATHQMELALERAKRKEGFE